MGARESDPMPPHRFALRRASWSVPPSPGRSTSGGGRLAALEEVYCHQSVKRAGASAQSVNFHGRGTSTRIGEERTFFWLFPVFAPHTAPALVVHEAPPPSAHARRRAPKPADSHTYTSNRPYDLHSTYRHLQARASLSADRHAMAQAAAGPRPRPGPSESHRAATGHQAGGISI